MRTFVHKAIARLAAKGTFDPMEDKPYIKMLYWARMGKRLHLDAPQTFNEKLQKPTKGK